MNKNDAGLYDTLEMQAGWLGIPAPERTEIDSGLSDGDSLRLGPAKTARACTRRPHAG